MTKEARIARRIARGAVRRGEEDLGAAADVEREEQRDQAGRDQLDEDSGTVDRRHQTHAESVDHGREDDEDGAEHDCVAGEIVGPVAVAHDLEAAPEPRQVELQGEHHGRERHDRGGEHQPAG